MKKLLFMIPVLLLLAACFPTPAQEGYTILVSDQGANTSPSGTQFLVGFGTGPFQTTEVTAQRTIPVADAGPNQEIIGNLHVRMSTGLQGSGATFQVTLRTCTPSGTPLACTATSRVVTCTIASGDADCSDTTDTFTVAAGDFIDWQTVQTDGTGTSSTYVITFTMQ